jgi:DNA-binding transcriptional MerR regulator
LNKAPDAFRTISEVAGELDLPQHVLRFWESRFPHIKPLKRGGGRRYYRPDDIDLLRGIRRLLYSDGYTIRGVQRILREQGVHTVQLVGQGQEVPTIATLPREGHEEGRNGGLARLNFPNMKMDGAARNGGGGPAAHVPARPQNGPTDQATIPAVHPAAVLPVMRLEAGHLDRAPAAVAPASAMPAAVPAMIAADPAVPVAATPAGRAPAGNASAAAAPPAVAKLSPTNMTARDLERLKQALADLEACRRLLDKAIDGEP